MAGVRGQGRKFDVDSALDKAMFAFWEHGYEGTSVSMLTGAMGINPPSLYSAFGGKEGLFFAAVDRYLATRGDFMARAFAEEPQAAKLISRLLYDAAVHYTDDSCPGGCLIISSAVGVTDTNRGIADRLRDMRNANVALLSERISENIADGILPPSWEPVDVAELIGVIIQGMSQRARDGATRGQLERVADRTLASLGPTDA
ncbi:TetR family transcriptional regulator [Rhodococcus sp. 15-725-2-2b]|uniref:TetR/AcrR family transcriptional regulator n=1 Tax=unclassified Rhodococcus (in: high G+C Gram-positive bacteria) TaxID=192944 RepID=UPI000B9B5849|nr:MULTISPECIES: TetR/AcrR family transcriptional regulator [unclassified Rhodococcus (in: high G+C Gram-positive bacteria)]OZC67410.1 TetR family transcriptional regulator [Rhodococcus sp. 06-469-3-2]OZD49388.1 TetR family transcriptional regulator [Rhodococcus sp. 06-1477-1A]OZE71871.1 TetR family transcriptional regulator [Rhodococcus sp. 15-725-2-2b]